MNGMKDLGGTTYDHRAVHFNLAIFLSLSLSPPLSCSVQGQSIIQRMIALKDLTINVYTMATDKHWKLDAFVAMSNFQYSCSFKTQCPS